MEDKIILNHKALKCDHCDYRDDTVERYQYESMINRACLQCGENLLTLEDYNNVLVLEQAVRMTNNLSEEQIAEMTAGISKETEEKLKTWLVDTHKDITFTEK